MWERSESHNLRRNRLIWAPLITEGLRPWNSGSSGEAVWLFQATPRRLCVQPSFPVQLLPSSTDVIKRGLYQNRWTNPPNIWHKPPTSPASYLSLLKSAHFHSRHSRERLNIACAIVFTFFGGASAPLNIYSQMNRSSRVLKGFF